MPPPTVDFDAPNLAAEIERLSLNEVDDLPFGVILLDREDTVLFYSKTEARLSGYGKIPIGRNWYELSICMANDEFQGRIARAREKGPVDLEFGWTGDYNDPKRDLRFRIQSASSAEDIWIFIERDNGDGLRGAAKQ
jgi:photoactive yellow protein